MLPVVVVGLGNPGKKYAGTRHNIGFMVVEKLAEKLNWSFRTEDKFFGRHVKGSIEGRTVHLLLPETYMNNSGKSVKALADFYKVLAPECLIVMDEISLPFGDCRYRVKGSANGHNGLKSIEASFGTPNTPRLKLGVGDERVGTLSDHVLSPFTAEEQGLLPEFIDRAAEVVKRLLTEDSHKVMTAVNTKIGPQKRVLKEELKDEKPK